MAADTPQAGTQLAPLVLRLALGVTFIWAGLSKLVPLVEFQPADAAILANLGTGIVPSRPSNSAPGLSAPDSGVAPASPTLAPPPSLPLPGDGKAPAPKGDKPAQRRAPAPSGGPGYAALISTEPLAASPVLANDLPAAAERSKPGATARTRKQPTPGATTGPAATPAPAVPIPVPPPAAATVPPGGKYRASDFLEPVKARRAYGLCVLMVRAAYPQPTVAASAPQAYWPAGLASSPWVTWLAFGAAVTELFAGVLLIVGFLTRISALSVVGLMAVAMWLTQIGPAMSVGRISFGVLPDRTWWDAALWSTFFWQLMIMAGGLAVALSGAGWLSVDRALAIIGTGGQKADEDSPGK